MGPWVCALLVSAAAPASGQQLAARHYTIADGFANNTIGSVYQDRKGYLWFATAEGLSRFDGYTFSSYGLADGLPHTIAHAVAEDVSGTLWVATTGGLVRLLDTPAVSRGRFVAHRVGPAPASNQLDFVVSDRAGAIGCVTGDGLYRGNGDGAATTFTRVVDVGPRGSTALFVDRRGRVWYAPDRELFVVSPDGIERYPADEEPTASAIVAFAETRAGRLLAVSRGGLFEHVSRSGGDRAGRWKRLLTLAFVGLTSSADAAVRVNPTGVNVNSNAATTVFLTFGGLSNQRPAERCGAAS